MARAQIGLSRWQDAADAAARAVSLAPLNAFPHLFLSRALMELGQGDQALAVAQEAVRLSPQWWVSHAHLAELASEPALTPPRRDLAWSAANHAVELAPLEASAHAACGLVALRLQYHQLAEQALRRASSSLTRPSTGLSTTSGSCTLSLATCSPQPGIWSRRR